MRNSPAFTRAPLPAALAFLAMMLTASVGHAQSAAETAEKLHESRRFQQVCANAVGAAERAHKIPAKLLVAIAHAESGRWSTAAGASIAWPWTVTAEGTGHYLPSRAAAIAKVEALRARGVSNIDVGCMQVNLHYHPDAFASLDAAFDPDTNAAYAGRFLAALKRETGNWGAATARYHSATREFAVPYRAKVMRLWAAARTGTRPQTNTPDADAVAVSAAAIPAPDPEDRKRKAAAETHRRAVVAAYLARRAELRTGRRGADG